MLSRWREGVSPETAHIRELAGLPGTGHQHGLPIESHADTIRDAIETKPICAVRSPPGSGKDDTFCFSKGDKRWGLGTLPTTLEGDDCRQPAMFS